MPAPERLAYSVKEAVAASSLSKSNIYRLVQAKVIESNRVRNRIVIPAHALRALLEGKGA